MSRYIIFIIILFSHLNMIAQENKIHTIVYESIGIFHTHYTPETGAPRQGVLLPEGKGEISIYPEYQSGLQSLDLFEFIIVLFHFDKVEGWSPTVNPPASSTDHEFGVFSTRSPKRPNPIGFTIVKLEKIENGKLYVSGVDAFDGTPILDIKPYLPSIDCVRSIQNELAEEELGHHDEVFINDSTFYK